MDSEIEFGKIEQAQPTPGCRPDRDKHFAAIGCGEPGDADLPIFVDMDALRDMEAHARENTRVELGGVMLGRHHVDGEGQPFVVIVDSLRARHYEATRGSFKFTHDTWNQITRERNEFRPDLEMVGWYHTHPGWGVFLSGMDLFICNHFFNRPQDVALVIDPCAGERGWFQWQPDEPGSIRKTGGFFLTTNRHRRRELMYFSEVFERSEARLADPRFQQPAFPQDPSQEDSMVHVIDNRRPFFELAIASMLVLQLLAILLLGWRLTERPAETDTEGWTQRLAAIEAEQDIDRQRWMSTVREQALADVLEAVVAAETGQGGLVEKYQGMAEQNRLLSENLQGQLARVRQSMDERDQLAQQLKARNVDARRLEKNLSQTRQTLQSLKQQNRELKSRLTEEASVADTPTPFWPPWLTVVLGGAGILMVGVASGFLFSRMQGQWRDETEMTEQQQAAAGGPDDSQETEEGFRESPVHTGIRTTEG